MNTRALGQTRGVSGTRRAIFRLGAVEHTTDTRTACRRYRRTHDTLDTMAFARAYAMHDRTYDRFDDAGIEESDGATPGAAPPYAEAHEGEAYPCPPPIGSEMYCDCCEARAEHDSRGQNELTTVVNHKRGERDARPMPHLSAGPLPQRVGALLFLPHSQMAVSVCDVRRWHVRTRRPRRPIGDVLLGRPRAPTTYDLVVHVADARKTWTGERTEAYNRAFATRDAAIAYIDTVLNVRA